MLFLTTLLLASPQTIKAWRLISICQQTSFKVVSLQLSSISLEQTFADLAQKYEDLLNKQKQSEEKKGDI